MNGLVLQVARLLYPEMDENDIVQRLQSVKQSNPNESDDNIILGLIDDYINDDTDEDD